MNDHTTPSSDQTGDRDVPSGADRAPTPEEEELAEKAAEQAPDVGETYAASAKTGANLQGEGQVEPA